MGDMAETDKETKSSKKPLSLSRPGKLELKKTVEGGSVRQNFSHGRSKLVTVEVRKKRTFTQDSGGEMTEVRDLPLEAQELGQKPDEQPDEVEDANALSKLTDQEKIILGILDHLEK